MIDYDYSFFTLKVTQSAIWNLKMNENDGLQKESRFALSHFKDPP